MFRSAPSLISDLKFELYSNEQFYSGHYNETLLLDGKYNGFDAESLDNR